MLETLTKGFKNARDRFRGVTELSEENVSEALREVRMSLLEADVDLAIVRSFLDQVKERCLGEEVRLRGKKNRETRVSPGDHFAKACYDELVLLMGEEAPFEKAKGTRLVMLIGLQGTGKTSTAAKLALQLKRDGEKPLLVAADVYRPAARDQLKVLGEQTGIEVFTLDGDDAAAICEAGAAHARENNFTTVIFDTAGRLQIDDELMTELETIHTRTKPDHITLVCDAMMGREAVNVAKGFAERLDIDGLILTKLDGDARGGAALAIRTATGVPVRYVTMGEGVDRLESFRPEGMATRILGMGDVVGLVQDFEQVIDEEQAEEEAERMLSGQFTFDDFLSQLKTIQKMGPLKGVLEKMPFAGDMFPDGANVDEREVKKIEAIALSMTKAERKTPDIIDVSRVKRISKGSGTQEKDVNELLKRFEMMRQMMGQLGSAGGMAGLGNLLNKIPGVGKLLGGPGGLDPNMLAQMGGGPGGPGMGPPSNRAAARAQKQDAKRNKRKQQRKHKRRGKRR